jgi:hypothetical protein
MNLGSGKRRDWGGGNRESASCQIIIIKFRYIHRNDYTEICTYNKNTVFYFVFFFSPWEK